MTPVLELQDAVVLRGHARVLDGVTLQVRPGELVGVLGPNGAGKTTLLRAALGLQPLASGAVRLGGADPRRLAPEALAARAAYLPQERRVGWNLPAWRLAALGAALRPPARAREAALRALDRVGLGPLAERGVLDMSGGERARALLARLLAADAPLLLVDEPTAGLDPDAQLMVLEILQAHAAAGGAVVATLHDLGLAARACHRVCVLDRGRLIASGPPREALSPQVLAAAFGLQGALIDTPAGPLLAARRLKESP
jgi:iron complex transport system ATP-binding protein